MDKTKGASDKLPSDYSLTFMTLTSIKLCFAGIFVAALGNASVVYQGTGTFTFDSDTLLLPLSVITSGQVTIFTTSFGNGSGGFEPVLTLFDGSGNFFLQDATGGTTGHCGSRATDPISGFCLDAFIQANLAVGSYTVALSESDNIPGGTLTDGFPQPAGTNFTGPEFLGGPGSFILFDGTQRQNNWALEIDSTGVATIVPEPGAFSILASVFASALLVRRLRRQNP
jgi:hypothetical protein